MVLGSADILLTELLNLLTARQAAILTQVAISRAPMSLDHLAFTLTPTRSPSRKPLPARRIWRLLRPTLNISPT